MSQKLPVPFNGFKKISENEKSAILQHPLGHKITIAKNVLSQGMKKQLSDLRLYMADGGEAPEQEEDIPEQAPESPPQASFDPSLQNQVASINPSAPPIQPQVVTPPPAGMAGNNLYSQGIGEQEAAIKGQAAAEGKTGTEQAAAIQKGIDAQQNALQNFQTQYAQHDQEQQKVADEIRQNMIDPKRYWNDRSTAGKISTSIGLILGGMGGGLMHQENPAMKMLQNQIANDIESQKSNLGARENLLSAAHQRTQDSFAANQLAMSTGLQIAKSEVEKVAAQNQNPLVQARAQQLLGQLHQQQGMYQYNLTMSGMLNNGQLPASAAAYLPKELQEKAVKLPDGTLAQATSKEDAETSRKAFDTYDQILDQIKGAKAFQDEHGRTVPLSDADKTGDRIQEGLQNKIRELWSIKRLSPELGEHLSKIVLHPGGVRQDNVTNAYDELTNEITSMKNHDANAYLQGPNKAPTSVVQGPNMAPPNMKAKSNRVASK
jgi:hypothetical protein